MSRGKTQAVFRGLCVMGAISAFATLALAAAPSLTGAQMAKQRVTNFREMGSSFKRLNDELKKSRPNLQLVREMADKVAAGTQALPTWFPRGSGAESGAETRAKPAIWTNATDFAALSKTGATEALKLKAAAAAGNAEAIEAQAKRLGAACSACHKPYRAPVDE